VESLCEQMGKISVRASKRAQRTAHYKGIMELASAKAAGRKQMNDLLDRVKVCLDSWHAYPAKTLGPQPTRFVRKMILDLGGFWPQEYPHHGLGEEAAREAHALLEELYKDRR
jgi:hypothetical protein